MSHNDYWLCDCGFCAQSFFKTAIAKPVLSIVIFSKAMAKMAKADKTNNNDRETNAKSTF